MIHSSNAWNNDYMKRIDQHSKLQLFLLPGKKIKFSYSQNGNKWKSWSYVVINTWNAQEVQLKKYPRFFLLFFTNISSKRPENCKSKDQWQHCMSSVPPILLVHLRYPPGIIVSNAYCLQFACYEAFIK